MGVLPLQFKSGDTVESLGLSGEEEYFITGLTGVDTPPHEVRVRIIANDESREFNATVRIDTPAEAAHFIHGGILPYVLRQLLDGGTPLKNAAGR